jgi:F-type H+-transporting ATPase subunit delta
MAEHALTARYVNALFEHLPTEQVGQVHGEVCAAAELWRASDALRAVMRNPFIPVEEKREAMERIAERAGWLETVRRFLGVLVDNDRIALLDELAPVVGDFVRAHLGREIAVIESPVPLSDDQTSRLAQRLGRRLGVTLIPQVEVKPELIGGLRVRVGDTMYDATIAGSMRALREELTKGRAE